MYPKVFVDYFRGFERSPEVFVAMPFSTDAEPRWKMIFSPAVQAVGLRPRRVREGKVGDSIATEILTGIGRARLVLVDLSFQRVRNRPPGPNPNVMYELGLAHAMRLPEEVVIVRGDTEHAEPPFDISQIRYHRIDARQERRARAQVIHLLKQAEKNLDATRDLIVERVLRALDPDMMRFLWAVHETDAFDLAVFDPQRKGLYNLGTRETTESRLRMLGRILISRGLIEAADPGSTRGRAYGASPEYRITQLGAAVASRLPGWCKKERQ